MSQSWFSLGFLSQNSLWKLYTFCGYKGIYSRVCEECEKSFFCITGHSNNSVSWVGLVTSLSRDLTAWLNCTFCHVVLQLLCDPSAFYMLHMCGTLATCQSQDPVTRSLWMHTTWVFLTLSHIQLLHNSHLNTGYLIAKIQANLAWNKDNTWLNKFNLIVILTGNGLFENIMKNIAIWAISL